MFRDFAIRLLVVSAGLACLLNCSCLEGGEVKWNKDLRGAAERAADEKKPLMIMVSAPWCGYCQKMLKTTFRDEALITQINECFIPVYLDADENQTWVEQLQVEGLPTTLLVSPEMKVVKRLQGFQSADQLNGQIVKLCQHPNAPVPVKPALAKKQIDVAFGGTCLVSLRDDGKLVQGGNFTSTYKGRLVRFASQDHKQRFDVRPELYWPVADGLCIVSDRMEQTKRAGEPVLAMIYADHVWFFADKARQEEFVKNPRIYLTQLAQNVR